MRDIIKGTLIHTKWGLAIEFKGKYAFLDIPNYNTWKNYQLGVELTFKLYYSLMYKKIIKDKKSEKWIWVIINFDNIDHAKEHTDFINYNLNVSDLQPMISLLNC
jgi:hypothetical protein